MNALRMIKTTHLDLKLVQSFLLKWRKEEKGMSVVRNLVMRLNFVELMEIFDWEFTCSNYVKELFAEHLTQIIGLASLQQQEDFAEKLLKKYDESKDYHKSLKCAYYLSSLLEKLPKGKKQKILKKLLQSPYSLVRRRAYQFLQEEWSDDFTEQILKNWERYEDSAIVQLFISDIKLLKSAPYLKEIISELDADGAHLHFAARLERNKLIARYAEVDRSFLEKLQESDPLSYVFVKKIIKEPLDDEFAYKLYSREKKKYLLSWYIELGMFTVANKILKDLLE